MDKTNINPLVQSIERSLHLTYKNQFSIKQLKFNQIWPEFQSIISLNKVTLNSWQIGFHKMVPFSTNSCGHSVYVSAQSLKQLLCAKLP